VTIAVPGIAHALLPTEPQSPAGKINSQDHTWF